jgi:hypothetical protein
VVQPSPDTKLDPFSKITNTKRAGGVARGIELLPSKHKAERSGFIARSPLLHGIVFASSSTNNWENSWVLYKAHLPFNQTFVPSCPQPS